MNLLSLLCILLALVLFALAARRVGDPKYDLGWAGLFFVTLAGLIGSRFGGLL